jgi:XTP/dITP diphosphohydrolase
MTCKLLLATNNQGKVTEFRSLLADLPYELVTPRQVGITTVVAETGTSYAENARLKATALAKESGLVTLADDSGLEVDALNGAPGWLSARYAGENASDRERVNYLLAQLKDTPREKRTARFCCVICLATPDGRVDFASGECDGMVAFTPGGELGFGYDPIFYFPELDKTMAELPLHLKNKVSHRGQAARKAIPLLESLFPCV